MITFLYNLFNILFPSDQEIKEIERLSPEEFLLKTTYLKQDPPHDIKSLFNYRDPLVQYALWQLKYKGNRIIACLFGTLLYEAILEEISEKILFCNFINPLLIPLPLSREKRKKRGWNQSEMLVKEIISHDTHHIFSYSFSAFIKHKSTLSQTHLSKYERMKNLKDCFKVPEKEIRKIKGRNIILIDDVTTTGSTMKEAMDTLRRAGARKVIGFTVAH